jgi:hypothetical protein
MWRRRRRQRDASLLALSASDPAKYGAELIERVTRPPTSLLEGFGIVTGFSTGCSAVYVLIILVLMLVGAAIGQGTEWLAWIACWFFGLCGAAILGYAVAALASRRTAKSTLPLMERLEALSRESPEHLLDSLPVLDGIAYWSRDEERKNRISRFAAAVRAVAPPPDPRDLPLPAHSAPIDTDQLPRVDADACD